MSALGRGVAVLGVSLVFALPASAQVANNDFTTSVHILVGQTPMRTTLANGENAFYDAPVVATRSYCAEATASETESQQTQADLVIFHNNHSTLTTTEGRNLEPKGATASRMCFIAATSETIFIRLTNNAAGSAEYSVRFVETTLWSNWFFTGGDYSSYSLIRNTTNAAITIELRWFSEAGVEAQQSGQVTQTVPANGVVFIDARAAMGCRLPMVCTVVTGSVQMAHPASPQALVGSQTTLSSSTGLSFDTIFFQRRPW
jgi:hypothetical protein